MEEISHNVEKKKKRGRPPLKLFSPEVEAVQEKIGVYDGVRTARTRQNWMYRLRAMSVLGVVKDDRFKWLFDVAKVMADEPRAERNTILSELGRIEDEDLMRVVALRLCEKKPPTKEAVSQLRRLRLGKSEPGDEYQLGDRLTNTLCEYLDRYPQTTMEQVCEALSCVARVASKLTAECDSEKSAT